MNKFLHPVNTFLKAGTLWPLDRLKREWVQNKDLLSEQSTLLEFETIHHLSHSTDTSLSIYAWTGRTTATSIMSTAAALLKATHTQQLKSLHQGRRCWSKCYNQSSGQQGVRTAPVCDDDFFLSKKTNSVFKKITALNCPWIICTGPQWNNWYFI